MRVEEKPVSFRSKSVSIDDNEYEEENVVVDVKLSEDELESTNAGKLVELGIGRMMGFSGHCLLNSAATSSRFSTIKNCQRAS